MAVTVVCPDYECYMSPFRLDWMFSTDKDYPIDLGDTVQNLAGDGPTFHCIKYDFLPDRIDHTRVGQYSARCKPPPPLDTSHALLLVAARVYPLTTSHWGDNTLST